MFWTVIGWIVVGLLLLFVFFTVVACIKKPNSVYAHQPEEQNPVEGKRVVFVPDPEDAENADGFCGHLEVVGDAEYHPTFYAQVVKRFFDVFVSFFGLVLLSPIFLAVIIAIEIDDPGPVFFTQKRVGRNKRYFRMFKFRSMKMSTPHDVPTHMLENPDSYITKVGAFIRSHSLDELPQIWNIFIGNMSIIGPRPALWNQDCLTAQRDKYGANEVKPGLTGYAQINGRDELSLEEKSRLDGEYARRQSFGFDCACFFGSIVSVFRKDGIVEGGTGEREQEKEQVTE